MTLPHSGPLTFSAIQGEYGGSNPIAVSEYYAGGANVPSGTVGDSGPIPSSGPLALSKFYGSSKNIPITAGYVDINQQSSGIATSVNFNSAVGGAAIGGGNGGPYTVLWTYVSGDASIACSNTAAQFPSFSATVAAPPGTTVNKAATWHVHITDGTGINTPYDQDVHIFYEYSRN